MLSKYFIFHASRLLLLLLFYFLGVLYDGVHCYFIQNNEVKKRATFNLFHESRTLLFF